MSTLQDRISEIMRITGKTVGEIADIAGVSSSAVTQWKDGPTKTIKTSPATRLEAETGYSARWIATGEGAARLPTSTAEIHALVDQDDAPHGVRIPLLANSARMGPGSDIEHDDVILGALTVSPDWLTRRIRPSSPGALRFIHAYGDSMSPTLEDGDVALVDTGRIDPSGADGVYVLATDERIFIKRVTERFNGGHDVTSDNPTVKTVQELNGGSSIRVLGKVVWVWNGKKL